MNTEIQEVRLNTYSVYKGSGVEWLGEIPEHWGFKKVTHFFDQIGSGTTPTSGDIRYYDGEFSFLQTGDLNDGRIKKTTRTLKKKAFQDFSSLKIYPKESLVMAMYGATIGKLGILDIEAATNQACCVFIKSSKVNSNFFFNVLFGFRKEIVSFGYGGGQPNISQDLIKSLRFPFPPLSEQTAIANFLDDKCAKIDAAVEIKQQQIALLKERRQIAIHQAVTQGLDKNVSMKDSGVEWIGEIPEHWEIKNLRYVFTFLNPKRIPLSALERENMQGEFPYYGASGIIDYVNDFIFDEKTILIAEDGANLISKSTPLAFVAEGKYWVNNHAHILRPNYSGFIFWAEQLSLIDYTTFISGAAQPKLSKENLGAVKVIVPSMQDIEKISIYIKDISQKITSAISLYEQEIEKLKEYKTTLINSAVTGKIKVPGVN